jgi:hypothetical protein
MAESPDATVRIAYNGNWYAKLTRAAASTAGPVVVSVGSCCSYAATPMYCVGQLLSRKRPRRLPYLHSSRVVITCQRFNFVQASVHFRRRCSAAAAVGGAASVARCLKDAASRRNFRENRFLKAKL